MPEDPHTKLMLRFQGGDEKAFRELYEEYKSSLVNFIFRFCQDRRVAEDLSHEVFLRVYKAVSSYRPEAKFSTWIYRIATNICLNELRTGKYQYEINYVYSKQSDNGNNPAVFPDTCQMRPDDKIASGELQAAVRKAIAQLPQKQRVALLLNIYHQLSYREIGERIGCSEAAVKSMIHRSKIAVKERLKKSDHCLSKKNRCID